MEEVLFCYDKLCMRAYTASSAIPAVLMFKKKKCTVHKLINDVLMRAIMDCM